MLKINTLFIAQIKYLFIHFLILFFPNKINVMRSLIYHSIFKKKKIINDIHSVQYSDFKKQIKILSNNENYKVTTIQNYMPLEKNLTKIIITFDDGYKDTFKLAYPILKKNKLPFTVFITTSNIKNKSKIFLNKSEIKQLAKDPLVTIGSHSVNHLNLNKLSKKKLIFELKESKKYLEKITNKKINCISFPNGEFNKRVISTCKMTGYKYCFNSIPTFNSFKKNKTYLVNRQAIILFDKKTGFLNKIRGKYDMISNLKKFKYSNILKKK